jgi:transcriptional regulator with XRE-family HTH domain
MVATLTPSRFAVRKYNRGEMLDTERIRELREKLNLTQAQAAERAEMSSPQKWSDIENGRRANVTIDTLTRIAAALGVKPKDLLK